MEIYDLLVIGAGVNGAGIARDAAGRGLRVLLVERDDVAGATSSASSKLIHGGLRYLEYREFRLVAEALAEREVLLSICGHLAWPMSFVLPHAAHLRPRWLLRAGLFLYDRLGGRSSLPRSHAVDLHAQPYAGILQPQFRHGFVYSDGWIDDSRLVVANVRDAIERGAQLRLGCEVEGARRAAAAAGLPAHWQVTLSAVRGGAASEVRARAIVNAAGPWAGGVQQRLLAPWAGGAQTSGSGTSTSGTSASGTSTPVPTASASTRSAGATAAGTQPVRLKHVKGSHIVVPRLYDGEHAYILQHPDRRIVFLIPFERAFTLIGTTDVEVGEDYATPVASASEIDYLCGLASQYAARAVRAADVVWHYSGVRALADGDAANASAASRDYSLRVDGDSGEAPLLSVLGGKITTYRALAQTVMDRLQPWLAASTPIGAAWTAAAALPGADLGAGGYSAWRAQLGARLPDIEPAVLDGLARRHGTRVHAVLDGATTTAALGEAFGGGLHERELAYLLAHEWVAELPPPRALDAVLWRRTKCGLAMSAPQRQRLAQRLGAAS
jgi:glycerol-3-phosphate dehydrogenase